MATPGYIPFHPNPKKPDITLPAGSCDSHCHVFGPGKIYPYSALSSYIPVDAPKEILFQRHQFLGIDRAVIVQASCHGTDNRAMLDTLKSAGDSYRGIAMVSPDITEKELAEMHELGVRGVRFNFLKRLKSRPPAEAIDVIVKKISKLPWHIVVYFEPSDLPEIRQFLQNSPIPVVIDHMGRVPAEKGVLSAEFEDLASLMKDERFYVKVSCPERLSKTGSPYSDTDDVAKELINMAPKRVLWGTDWPHPNMKTEAPDDGALVDRITVICPQEKNQRLLLIDNPQSLYWAV